MEAHLLQRWVSDLFHVVRSLANDTVFEAVSRLVADQVFITVVCAAVNQNRAGLVRASRRFHAGTSPPLQTACGSNTLIGVRRTDSFSMRRESARHDNVPGRRSRAAYLRSDGANFLGGAWRFCGRRGDSAVFGAALPPTFRE